MKLKTLKDMPKRYSMNHPIEKSGYYVFIDELKQEAIKWVKKREKEYDDIEGEGYGRQYLIELMEFHNITEEDLK